MKRDALAPIDEQLGRALEADQHELLDELKQRRQNVVELIREHGGGDG